MVFPDFSDWGKHDPSAQPPKDVGCELGRFSTANQPTHQPPPNVPRPPLPALWSGVALIIAFIWFPEKKMLAEKKTFHISEVSARVAAGGLVD